MIAGLFYFAYWSLPLWALGFLFAFALIPSKRWMFSGLFSLFSLLTYATHVSPYLLAQTDYEIVLTPASANEMPQHATYKIAVVNNYTSSYVRNEAYLEQLWHRLESEGFDGLIVRAKPFSLGQPLEGKENLRIFGLESFQERDFVLALSRKEALLELKTDSESPLIWIDMEGEGGVISPYFGRGVLSVSLGERRDNLFDREDTNKIHLEFVDQPQDWFSFLSLIDLTVLHLRLRHGNERSLKCAFDLTQKNKKCTAFSSL